MNLFPRSILTIGTAKLAFPYLSFKKKAGRPDRKEGERGYRRSALDVLDAEQRERGYAVCLFSTSATSPPPSWSAPVAAPLC